MSDKTEYLNMIQKVIDRMANNSLQIKCWSIAIVTAFAALSNDWIVAISIVPLVLFCFMDARYLSMERAYRELFEAVRKKDESEIDFLMDYEEYDKGIWKTMFTWWILAFYIVLVSVVSIITIVRVVM